MERRDFLKAAAMSVSALKVVGEPIIEAVSESRLDKLLDEGRLINVRLSYRESSDFQSFCHSTATNSLFPVARWIERIDGTRWWLPVDAIPSAAYHYCPLYCGWIQTFAHESFDIADPYCHLPIWSYCRQ